MARIKPYIFVGEKPSKRATDLGVTWETGGLAAKPLFRALYAMNIDPDRVGFINLFGDSADDAEKPNYGVLATLAAATRAGVTVVGMGKKVQRYLDLCDVPHKSIVHPAARGAIRDKHRYIDHVKEQLLGKTHSTHPHFVV